ncbi:MAG: hypothetical protein NTY53_20530 [Kiritimatiellaeota bacterium]|nr:hypothetical protein [Kiritimatiellota bacterium]
MDGRNKQLMLLMTQHQRHIFSYIYTLIPNQHDAADILQETSLVICEKFHEFQPGTDFVAWACQIAWWRVRAVRKKYACSKVKIGSTFNHGGSIVMKFPQATQEFLG